MHADISGMFYLGLLQGFGFKRKIVSLEPLQMGS